MALDRTVPETILGLTLRQASDAIAARRLSPVELVDAYLYWIETVDGRLRSYITVLAEEARAAAFEAEAEIAAGNYRGPLHGLPYAVKDNYFTKGVRTTANSRLRLDAVPDTDATAIVKLRDAGAILLGKLNTWEYGTGMGPFYDDLPFPYARNPWNLDRYTGGSSTGAGASVAGRTALFALGSDTGGSVRLPAAACGLQGLKSTTGRISRHGIFPNCWAFDVAGPLCWNVEDCAIVAEALSGFDPSDPISVDRPADFRTDLTKGVAGLRIGIIRDMECNGVRPDPDILANLAEAARVLEAAGAILVETELPAPVLRYRSAASVINWAESYSIHEADFQSGWHRMGQALRDKMTAGLQISAVDYLAALRERRTLAEMTDRFLSGFDAVLLPCAFHTAPAFSDAAGLGAFIGDTAATPFSMSGHPALSVCTGFDAEGLPTSAQIVGRWFDEAMVLRVGHAYETATPWRAEFPTF